MAAKKTSKKHTVAPPKPAGAPKSIAKRFGFTRAEKKAAPTADLEPTTTVAEAEIEVVVAPDAAIVAEAAEVAVQAEPAAPAEVATPIIAAAEPTPQPEASVPATEVALEVTPPAAPDVAAACRELHESHDADARSAAAVLLGRAGDRSAVAALVAGLRDDDADVARESATALGVLGDTAAVEPLIEVLANVDGYFHCVVRAAAAASLGQLGDPRATTALLTAVGDARAELSAESVRALALLGDRSAVEPLLDVLRNRYGFFLPVVRRAAVAAVAQLGGPEALAELRAIAEDAGEDPYIRHAARDAAA